MSCRKPGQRPGSKENDLSAPQTNLEKQKRRHRGPLIGMAAAVLFGVGLISYWLIEESAMSQNPAGPDMQPEGGAPRMPTTAEDASDSFPVAQPSTTGQKPASAD
jgi:hypothetical protein